jgi:hypothetical protein
MAFSAVRLHIYGFSFEFATGHILLQCSDLLNCRLISHERQSKEVRALAGNRKNQNYSEEQSCIIEYPEE